MSKLTRLTKRFDEIVRSHGDTMAVQCVKADGSTVQKTYSQFAGDIAGARQEIAGGRGSANVVATLGGNTYEHLVYIMAVWCEGLTLCPLNPEDGVRRNQDKIEKVGEPVFLVGERLGAPMELKSSPWSTPLELDSDRPMNLIFTSGSTGYGKIVEQHEARISANVESLIRHHCLQERISIGTPLPLFHVNALNFSVLCSFCSGGRLVLFEKFNPLQMIESVGPLKIQILSVVPHILGSLISRMDRLKAALGPDFRYFVTAAAALSPDMAKTIVNDLSVPVLQGYGLSEVVNFSCIMPTSLSPDEYRHWMLDFERPSVGKALEDSIVSIINEKGQELGAGQKGEICISGASVMKGYRGSKPLGADGLLKTGDLGFFEIDGSGEKYFFVTGRIKDTVKRLGHTVSLLEIDDLLARNFSGIKCVSVAFEHELGGEEIAVVVQATTEDNVPVAEMSRILAEQLPDYMRPRLIAYSRAEITTASGKPKRWQFASAFSNFKNQIMGNTVRFIGEVSPSQ